MIDYDQAVALLERAVAEKGEDYVYPQEERQYVLGTLTPICTYRREDGSPSCIIGHVAQYLGILHFAARLEGSSSMEVFESAGIATTNGAATLFSYAQYYQDENEPWGNALAMAKDHIQE